MTDSSGRPIVAELGRPETAEEIWQRKDRSRRAHREHQTAFNLVIALIASLGIVVLLVAVVARPNNDDSSVSSNVNYRHIAAQATSAGATLAAPKLPATYSSNRADFQDKTADGVDVWTVGLLTPDKQYIGIHQGIKANATWTATQLEQHATTGTRTIDGVRWSIVDRRDDAKAGNLAYAMTATFGTSTIVLAGTANNASFRLVATRITAQLS